MTTTKQRKDLRKNYIENKWLNKDDVSLAMKAFRMLQQKVDFEDLSAIYENLSYTLNGGNPQELAE